MKNLGNKIIVLDGAKGSGKSTTSKLLRDTLKDYAFLSMDTQRYAISGSITNDYYNDLAFESMVALTRFYLSKNISVVIDSGLRNERLNILKILSEELTAKVILVYLSCPKEELWDRVKSRDEERGKISNKERFDYVYEVQQSKDFKNHIEIDTSENKPESVVRSIISLFNESFLD
jgi:broad-specificity NMP kinase